MNCGECLVDRAAIVELIGGICPACGTDYSDLYDAAGIPPAASYEGNDE